MLREHGALVEEAANEDDDEGHGEQAYDEKNGLLEKVHVASGLQESSADGAGAVSPRMTEITLGDQGRQKQESDWVVDTDVVDI